MLLYDILNENRNVANIDVIEEFCDSLASRAATPAIAEWFRKVLRKYLIRDYPNVEPVRAEDIRNHPDLFPAWMVPRLDAGEDVVKIQITGGDHAEIVSIRDWMNGEQHTPLMQERDRLMRVSVPQALEAARQYHQNLRRDNEAKRATAMAVAVHGVEPVLEVENHRWVSLTTDAALEQEGTAMGHCVGKDEQNYKADVRSGKTQIYSLRDAKGFPHVTVEVSDGRVEQIQGKGNAIPVARYIPAVIAFLNHIKPKQVTGHYLERMGIAAVRRGRQMVYLPLADAMAEAVSGAEKRAYGDGVTFFQINDKIYVQVEGNEHYSIPRPMVRLDGGEFGDLLSQQPWYPRAALRWLSHFLQDMEITPKDIGRLRGLGSHNIYYLDGRWGAREDFAETAHYDGIDFLILPDSIVATVDGFDMKLANYDYATRTVAPNYSSWGGFFDEDEKKLLWPRRPEIVRFLNDHAFRLGLEDRLYGLGLMANSREQFGLIEEMGQDWGTYRDQSGDDIRFVYAPGSGGGMRDQRLFAVVNGDNDDLRDVADMQHSRLVRQLTREGEALLGPLKQLFKDLGIKLVNSESNRRSLGVPAAKGDYLSPEVADNPDQVALVRKTKGEAPDYQILNANVARHAGRMSAKAQETVLRLYKPESNHLVNPSVYSLTPEKIAACLGGDQRDWSDYESVRLSARLVSLLAIDSLGCFTDAAVRAKVDALYRKTALAMLSYARKNLKKFIEIQDHSKTTTEFGDQQVTPLAWAEVVDRIGMTEDFETMKARLIRAKEPLARRLRRLPPGEQRDYLLQYIDNQFRLDGRQFAYWYQYERPNQVT